MSWKVAEGRHYDGDVQAYSRSYSPVLGAVLSILACVGTCFLLDGVLFRQQQSPILLIVIAFVTTVLSVWRQYAYQRRGASHARRISSLAAAVDIEASA